MTTFMYYLFLIEMILLRHMNLPNLDSKTILEKFYTAMPMKHFLLTLVIILRHSNLRTRNSFLRHINFTNPNNKNIMEKFQTATLLKHLFLIPVIFLRYSHLRTRNSFHHQQPRSSCLQLDFSQ